MPYLHHQTSFRSRPRTQSFPQHVFYEDDLLTPSTPYSTATQTATLSPLLPTPRKRRRPSTISPTSPSDPVVGHITAAGKFRCSDTTCSDLTFGRQADFRRHYEHAHAAKKVEYFCTIDGCVRSQRPTGGGRSKGRSFGSREDKMREHVRTVHEKGAGKRRKVEEDDGESEGWAEEV